MDGEHVGFLFRARTFTDVDAGTQWLTRHGYSTVPWQAWESSSPRGDWRRLWLRRPSTTLRKVVVTKDVFALVEDPDACTVCVRSPADLEM